MNGFMIVVLVLATNVISIFFSYIITKSIVEDSEYTTNALISKIVSDQAESVDKKIKGVSSSVQQAINAEYRRYSELRNWTYNICTNSMYISRPGVKYDVDDNGMPHEIAKDGLIEHISPMGGKDEHEMLH